MVGVHSVLWEHRGRCDELRLPSGSLHGEELQMTHTECLQVKERE